jgi:hypothetical protein
MFSEEENEVTLPRNMEVVKKQNPDVLLEGKYIRTATTED